MTQDDLQQSLTKLHEELQRTTEVDADTRRSLTIVLAEIHRVIANPVTSAPAADQKEPSFASRLEVMIDNFETKHPQLTGVLQKLADRLAEMGI